MAPATIVGLAMLGASAALAAGGLGAWRHAAALPAASALPAREIPGQVVEIVTQTCGRANRTYPCYRPVVGYHDGGPKQTVARTATSPAPPLRKGAAASVLVFADGTAWIASEWRIRQTELRRDDERARRTPNVLGWILVGCAAFAAVLGLGLIFWIDRGEA